MDAGHIDPDFLVAMAAVVGGYAVSCLLGLLAHEGGHALAALLVGLEPRAIVVGRGPIVWRRRFRRMWLVVHAFPISGFAARLGDPHGRRGAQAFVVAAGPAMSLLLFAAAAAGLARGLATDSLVASEASLGLLVATGTHLLGSLWPRTFVSEGRLGLHATDGWKLLKLARGEDVDRFRSRYAKLLRTVLDEAEAGAPPSSLAPELVYQVTRGDRAQAWARADMADILVGLLKEPALSASERLFIVRRYKLESLEVGAG